MGKLAIKTPEVKQPITAKQAAELTKFSYEKMCEKAIQENLTRWKDEAIKAIEDAAFYGNYSTSIWISASDYHDKFEAMGLDDFCKWLRGFGYKVSTSDTKIHISWEHCGNG